MTLNSLKSFQNLVSDLAIIHSSSLELRGGLTEISLEICLLVQICIPIDSGLNYL